MERATGILSGQTAKANECEVGIPLSLAAPTTPQPRKLLIDAPLDTGTVVHNSQHPIGPTRCIANRSSKSLLCRGLAL